MFVHTTDTYGKTRYCCDKVYLVNKEQVNTNTLVHLVLLVLGETGFVAAKKQNKKTPQHEEKPGLQSVNGSAIYLFFTIL